MGRISYTTVNGVKDYFVWVIIHYKKHRRGFEGYFCVCLGGFCFVLFCFSAWNFEKPFNRCLCGLQCGRQFICRKQLVNLNFFLSVKVPLLLTAKQRIGRRVAWGCVWDILLCRLPYCCVPRKRNSANLQPLAEISQPQLSEQWWQGGGKREMHMVVRYSWVP